VTTLFLGNLPAEADAADVVAHFRRVGVTVSDVRIIRKQDGSRKTFGFVSVADEQIHDAIALNGVELMDRKVGVQISHGMQPDRVAKAG